MATRLQKAWLVGLPALALLVGSARADEAAAESEPALSITPIVTYIGVDGDEKKFREDWWINEGWSGGIEDATFDHKLGKDWQLHLEGRALFEQEDYLLRLEIVNPGIGFVKAGYTQYRKWFDDTGGFYEFFSTPSFSLGRDLHLDISDLFVEVGLTLPNLPKPCILYEVCHEPNP